MTIKVTYLKNGYAENGHLILKEDYKNNLIAINQMKLMEIEALGIVKKKITNVGLICWIEWGSEVIKRQLRIPAENS